MLSYIAHEKRWADGVAFYPSFSSICLHKIEKSRSNTKQNDIEANDVQTL